MLVTVLIFACVRTAGLTPFLHAAVVVFANDPTVPDMLTSAQAPDMDPGLIELFVDGKEDGLPDAGRLLYYNGFRNGLMH